MTEETNQVEETKGPEQTPENTVNIDLNRIIYSILKHQTKTIVPTEVVLSPIPENTRIKIDLDEDKKFFVFSLGIVEPTDAD